MKLTMTAGALALALLLAAVSAVNAKPLPSSGNDSVTPTIVVGE